jgi:hypothetical protein
MPHFTDPLWSDLGEGLDGKPFGEVIRHMQLLLRKELVAARESLKGCKDPEVAFANYLEEMQTNRGDHSDYYGMIRAHAMEPWSEWVTYWWDWFCDRKSSDSSDLS